MDTVVIPDAVVTKKIISVAVPTQAAEFMDRFKSFLLACDATLADGFQAGQDVPVMVTAAIQNLLPAIQQLKGARDDMHADPFGTAKVVGLATADVIEAFVTKK